MKLAKKIISYLLMAVGTVTILGSAYIYVSAQIKTHNEEQSIKITTQEYETNIAAATKINSEDFQNKVKDKEDFVVYFGRPTCPYCREFSPILNKAIQKTGKEVFYIQTRTDKKDKTLNKVRDTYKIESVPNVLRFKAGKLVSIYDETIMDFKDFLSAS